LVVPAGVVPVGAEVEVVSVVRGGVVAEGEEMEIEGEEIEIGREEGGANLDGPSDSDSEEGGGIDSEEELVAGS
jgi:hypothetical protein